MTLKSSHFSGVQRDWDELALMALNSGSGESAQDLAL